MKGLLEGKCSPEGQIIGMVCDSKQSYDLGQIPKKSIKGTSMCPLCKCDDETNEHLFNSYAYTKEVWDTLGVQYNLQNIWLEDTFIENFK